MSLRERTGWSGRQWHCVTGEGSATRSNWGTQELTKANKIREVTPRRVTVLTSAAHTARPTVRTVLTARMQTALAGNNSRLWKAAGKATDVLTADRRHHMGPMVCHGLDFEVSVCEWPRVTQTSLRLTVSSPCEDNVRVLFYFI